MYFFLKYIVTLFYKNLRIKIVVCLLRESGPRTKAHRVNLLNLGIAVVHSINYTPRPKVVELKWYWVTLLVTPVLKVVQVMV